jgi:hypothetical protein
MNKKLKKGDAVSWSSEAGRIQGHVVKKITQDTEFRGRTRQASKDEPQYEVVSDKTGAHALHKSDALRHEG